MEKKEIFNQKPLIEQIYDEFLENIECLDEFDTVNIQKLKELAKEGELNKYAKVTSAIKIKMGKKDEIAGTGN